MKVLTTGQVANRLKVSVSMVARWIDEGILKGYRLPGGGHRRILEKNLLEFCEEHNLADEENQ